VRKKELRELAWQYNLMQELADKAYTAGKEAALQYKRRETTDGLSMPILSGRLHIPRLAGQPIERWAYDAGYDAGVKERDAYEARRDIARGKTLPWARGGIVTSGGAYTVGEYGPETYTASGDETVTPATTEESEDE
jgi:hypothetical protein